MRGLKFIALLMMIGGLLLLCCFPVLMIHPLQDSSSAINPVVNRYAGFGCAYFGSVLVALGAGLRKGHIWGWDGAVFVSAYLAFLGAVFATILAAKHVKAPTAVVSVVAALSFIASSLLFMTYLFRPVVRTAFERKANSERPLAPFWIRLIAISTLLDSGIVAAEILRPNPAPVFGVIHNSLISGAYAIVSGIVSILVGIGLYRLSESARRLAITYFAISAMYVVSWTIFGAAPDGRFSPFRIGSLIFSMALASVEIWYLHTRRRLFSTTFLDSVVASDANIP